MPSEFWWGLTQVLHCFAVCKSLSYRTPALNMYSIALCHSRYLWTHVQRFRGYAEYYLLCLCFRCWGLWGRRCAIWVALRDSGGHLGETLGFSGESSGQGLSGTIWERNLGNRFFRGGFWMIIRGGTLGDHLGMDSRGHRVWDSS
jgi:hypothetical protein